ncbi:hypothetical protein SDC9_69096 [bioreactor metagenome]|uniref:Uncharacterized protein n=1 Tax=bioreactor metagenome TaxID=1076179 RepID=A0A644Y3Y8_9ZZZZ
MKKLLFILLKHYQFCVWIDFKMYPVLIRYIGNYKWAVEVVERIILGDMIICERLHDKYIAMTQAAWI